MSAFFAKCINAPFPSLYRKIPLLLLLLLLLLPAWATSLLFSFSLFSADPSWLSAKGLKGMMGEIIRGAINELLQKMGRR
jgi:hypothetical protein